MNDNEYNKIITTIKAKTTKPEEVQQTVGEIDHKVSIYDDMSEDFEKEIKDNYKDEYLKKYGKLPTDDEIELYKEDFQDELLKDKDTYERARKLVAMYSLIYGKEAAEGVKSILVNNFEYIILFFQLFIF